MNASSEWCKIGLCLVKIHHSFGEWWMLQVSGGKLSCAYQTPIKAVVNDKCFKTLRMLQSCDGKSSCSGHKIHNYCDKW